MILSDKRKAKYQTHTKGKTYGQMEGIFKLLAVDSYSLNKMEKYFDGSLPNGRQGKEITVATIINNTASLRKKAIV